MGFSFHHRVSVFYAIISLSGVSSMVEQRTHNPLVAGSNPAPRTKRRSSVKPTYQQIRDKAGIVEYRLYARRCGKDFMFLDKCRRGAMVAQLICNQWVGGSSPSGGTSSCQRLSKVVKGCRSRGVAQFGSAPALGAGCRRFKSCRPDQNGESYNG